MNKSKTNILNGLIFTLIICVPLLVFYTFSGNGFPVLGLICVGAAGAIASFFNFQSAMVQMLAFILPFSVDIDVLGSAQIALPAEPLIAILCSSYIVGLIRKQHHIEHLTKSKTVLILIGLLTVLWATTLTSSYPIISLKYVIIYSAYALCGTLLVADLIKTNRLSVKSLLIYTSIGLIVMAIYGLLNYAPERFSASAASVIARPFFKDHTVFSATLCLIVPSVFMLAMHSKMSGYRRTILILFGTLVLAMILLSTSRASWMGLFGAVFLIAFLLLKGRFIHLVGITIACGALVLFNLKSIETSFSVNAHDSSAYDSGVEEQAKSLGNLNSDVSNLERVNRWKCSVRMFQDKPLTGFGPGTFQFQYLPYQRIEEMTRISVNSPFNHEDGRGGTAHSEYFLILSESGMFGLLMWVLFIGFLLKEGISAYHLLPHRDDRLLLMGVLAGLVTYIIHSLFNNFLNAAHFGVLFWMLTGIVIAFSIKTKRNAS